MPIPGRWNGGIISSTALTLLVLPILYRMFHGKDVEEEDFLQPLPEAHHHL